MVQFGRQRHGNVMLHGAERSEAFLPSARWTKRFLALLRMTASSSGDNSERRLVGHAFYPILFDLAIQTLAIDCEEPGGFILVALTFLQRRHDEGSFHFF
jgi:hypothetical protein